MPEVKPLGAGEATPTRLAALAREMFVDEPWLGRLLQHLRPHICPLEDVLEVITPGSRVLDVGCGSGLLLGLAARTGRLSDLPWAASVGFDSSQDAIRVARAMTDRARIGHRVRFEHLRVQEPWPEGMFDAVTIIDVMHHVPLSAQAEMIRLASRHVRPGGRLIYKDMLGTGPRGLANTLHDLVKARQLVRYAPIAEVEALAQSEGLRLWHASDTCRLWYAHQLRVFVRPDGVAPA